MDVPRRKHLRATVRSFDADEGWGVLDEPGSPGGVFVSFGAIQAEGYKTLTPGQVVVANIEGPLAFDQDGYHYRATGVHP
jgi:CspA family cold shock protein